MVLNQILGLVTESVGKIPIMFGMVLVVVK